MVEDPAHVLRNASVNAGKRFTQAAFDAQRDDSVLEHPVFAFLVLRRVHDRTAAVAVARVDFLVAAGALKSIVKLHKNFKTTQTSLTR